MQLHSGFAVHTSWIILISLTEGLIPFYTSAVSPQCSVGKHVFGDQTLVSLFALWNDMWHIGLMWQWRQWRYQLPGQTGFIPDTFTFLFYVLFYMVSDDHLHNLLHKELGLAIRICAPPCRVFLVYRKVFGFSISVMKISMEITRMVKTMMMTLNLNWTQWERGWKSEYWKRLWLKILMKITRMVNWNRNYKIGELNFNTIMMKRLWLPTL